MSAGFDPVEEHFLLKTGMSKKNEMMKRTGNMEKGVKKKQTE